MGLLFFVCFFLFMEKLSLRRFQNNFFCGLVASLVISSFNSVFMAGIHRPHPVAAPVAC